MQKRKINNKNAGHTESCRVDTEKYWNRIEKFIEVYI